MNNLILVFSATGNSARLAGWVEHALKKADQDVLVRSIFRGSETISLDGVDRLVVVYPVLAMQAPSFVTRRLAALSGRRSDGVRVQAVVLACTGGGGGPAAERTEKLLAHRGFEPVLSAQVPYPENWTEVGAVPATDEAAQESLQKGDRAAQTVVEALVRGQRLFDRVGLVQKIIGYCMAFAFGTFGRRFLGKLFHANDNCNRCGLCVRTCPVGTITLGRSHRSTPFWKMSCENCNRCINLCPTQAINPSLAQMILLFIAITGLSLGAVFAGAPALDAWLKTSWPGWSQGWAFGLAMTLIIVAIHYLVVGPLDAWVFRWIRRIPFLRGLFSLTFTRQVRRYWAPGFHPRDGGSPVGDQP